MERKVILKITLYTKAEGMWGAEGWGAQAIVCLLMLSVGSRVPYSFNIKGSCLGISQAKTSARIL